MISVLRFLKSIPLTFWLAIVLTGALSGAITYHAYKLDQAERRGYQRAIDGARFDSTLLALVDTARAKAAHKTDTGLRVVKAKAARVDSQAIRIAALAAQLPVSLDTIPEVKELRALSVAHAAETKALTDSIAKLEFALTDERAEHKKSIDVRDGLIRDARLENAKLHIENKLLAERPTKTEALAYSLASATLGAGLSYAVSR